MVLEPPEVTYARTKLPTAEDTQTKEGACSTYYLGAPFQFSLYRCVVMVTYRIPLLPGVDFLLYAISCPDTLTDNRMKLVQAKWYTAVALRFESVLK